MINPSKQRLDCKSFFEDNIKLWDDYYDKNEGNPYKHNLNLLKNVLKNYNNKCTLLDIGCGTGIPLLEFLKMGFVSSGCDFTDSSVRLARNNLDKHGYSNPIFKADVEDETTLPKQKFDIIVSIGVFPHLVDDKRSLNNIKNMLNDRGTVLIQFRNDLFNLFTLNAYSKDFMKRLVDFNTLPEPLKTKVEEFYNERLSIGGINSEFDILSKFHNPLTIKDDLFQEYDIKNIHFFHYHRLPPIFQLKDNALFRKLGDEIENPNNWKGYFMASSFIVEAQLK